jgi:hypothetical protein
MQAEMKKDAFQTCVWSPDGLKKYTDGKTIIPAKTVLQQIADILKTPDIQAGVVQGSAAMHNLGPQVTEEEEGKRNAGDDELESCGELAWGRGCQGCCGGHQGNKVHTCDRFGIIFMSI